MRFIITIITILLSISLKVQSQVKKDFGSIPFIQGLDTLKKDGSIDFELQSITKEAFLELMSNDKPQSKDESNKVENLGDSLIFKTQNSYFVFYKNNEATLPYSYDGFIPAIECHLISYCKEICEAFLLDNFTDEKMYIPTSYDQGVIGMPFSPKKSMMLVFSSYDGPDYNNFYDHRAEIYFYKIDKGLGIKGLHFYGSYYTNDWSIEDIYWIDEKTLALKIYDESRWGDGSKVDYNYFKTTLQ